MRGKPISRDRCDRRRGRSVVILPVCQFFGIQRAGSFYSKWYFTGKNTTYHVSTSLNETGPKIAFGGVQRAIEGVRKAVFVPQHLKVVDQNSDSLIELQ